MAFREVRVFEVREVLRVWLGGPGFRTIERLVGVDRKTVRRYVEAAVELGLDREGGEEQLTDLFIAQVVERVRPHWVDGHGEAWRLLEEHADQIRVWLENEDLTVTKVGTLLARQGGGGLPSPVATSAPDRSSGTTPLPRWGCRRSRELAFS